MLRELDQSYLWFPVGMMGAGLVGGKRPPAPEADWARVDLLYREVSTALKLSLYVLLTDKASEPTSLNVYVFLEPFANLVIALDHVRGDVSICSDWWMWKIFRAHFDELTENAGVLLRNGRTTDSLTYSLDGLYRLLKGNWRIDSAYREGQEQATITHFDQEGSREWTVIRR